jgi:hypothetical protein
MSYDFNGLHRVTYEGCYDPEHKLIIEASQEWFGRGKEWTIPVRDVAVLFVPWHLRMNPNVYKMLRLFRVHDAQHWNCYIDIWLNILAQRGLETVDTRPERIRKPLYYPEYALGTVAAAMIERCRVEECFIIHKSSAIYKFDPKPNPISHASRFSWDDEEQLRYANIARIRHALTEAAQLDFSEDLKRWHEEQTSLRW